jgi:Helicase HerA, central domain
MPKPLNKELKWQQARKGSVQAEFVRLREIAQGVLCLASSAHAERREYRAVIEVSSANFTLQSEEEQELVIAGYRAFLKALSFPIQILLRSQQLDLTPYLKSLREATASLEMATATGRNATWKELAHSHEQFVRELAARRTLLEHRFYLILPSDQSSATTSHPLTFLLPFGRKGRQARLQTETLEKAQQQLDLRAEMVMQQLAAIGLHCHRLTDEELYALYSSCLTPQRALHAPLPPLSHSSVERPTKMRDRRPASTTSASPSPTTALVSQHAVHLQQSTQPHEERLPAQSQEGMLPLPDLPHLADLLAPASVEVSRDALCLEGEYVRGLAVTSFPREVFPGWLAPLLLHDEISEIVFHVHPQENAAMLRELLRRKNLYQSSRRVNVRRGRMDDPETQVAEQDVDALISQLASGEERVFEVSLYILVRASDRRTLDERTERMLALLSNLFLVARPTTFEHAQALRSFLPGGHDELMRTFTLDSSSLATAFPFISNALFMPAGVLVGVTPSGEPVVIDEWDESMDNPHEFCGAITGAGKSYFYKLRIMRELLRHRQQGLQVVVIDPEKEYEDLCQALGGDFVRLAPGSAQHLNPFDLLPIGTDLQSYIRDRSRGDRLADKVQGLHALFDIMLADHGPGGVTILSSREKGLLDRAIYETYRQVGITADPRTHGGRVPLLRDLYDVLRNEVCGKDDYGLADRLYRYIAGSLAGPFNAHTDVALHNHLLVFDIRDMSGELRPIGIFLITDFVWTQVLHSLRPRKLYIDEAWSLIAHPEGGRFLANLARRARKRYLALVTITQNPELFATDEWGGVVAANAATKVFKKQDRTSGEAITARFQLTSGERQRMLSFGKHEALLLAGGKRVIIQIEASPLEHALATTDPRELASRAMQKQADDDAFSLTRVPTQPLASSGNGQQFAGKHTEQLSREDEQRNSPAG